MSTNRVQQKKPVSQPTAMQQLGYDTLRFVADMGIEGSGFAQHEIVNSGIDRFLNDIDEDDQDWLDLVS